MLLRQNVHIDVSQIKSILSYKLFSLDYIGYLIEHFLYEKKNKQKDLS